MRDYVVNFWVWWYLVRMTSLAERAFGWSIFVLEYTNTLVMAKNLFVPMFQDRTGIGKMISFLIRLTWIWVGGLVSVVFILPIILLVIVVALLPVLVLVQIVVGIIGLIA